MKVLLTGSTGYIGKRLLKVLTERGDEVSCFVRNLNRLSFTKAEQLNISRYQVDLIKPIPDALQDIDLDVAFYLVHSMSSSINDFMEEEAKNAKNFADFIKKTNCKQIIYLSGISNSPKLSRHLESRKNVENILMTSGKALTVLRAGIIVGSGSASFEIIRDLMEKMPFMIAPMWVQTKCQPVGITDVMKYFTGCMLNEKTYNQHFDIGGSEILTYKQMLLQYAKLRGFNRWIGTAPIISPRLSSYWLYFLTSTSYKLAVNLVNSMKVEVVCSENRLQELLGIEPLSYSEACSLALETINLGTVTSSWTDALSHHRSDVHLFDYMEVPSFGTLGFKLTEKITGDPQLILDRVFSIGGNTGWYYGDWIWYLRGIMDRMVGGVGLRRGRRNPTMLYPGDALDFWRVLIADRDQKHLLLFAEMKVPGEAWLEFKILQEDDGYYLSQIATFMPRGLTGRIYWYSLLPIHVMMFKGMITNILKIK